MLEYTNDTCKSHLPLQSPTIPQSQSHWHYENNGRNMKHGKEKRPKLIKYFDKKVPKQSKIGCQICDKHAVDQKWVVDMLVCVCSKKSG